MTDLPIWAAEGGPPVVAFGGNALLPDARDPGAAAAQADAFAEAMLTLLPDDSGVVLVHGNGPQVGALLLQNEAARDEVPASPLDVLVAETQGSIGYLLSRSLRNALAARSRPIEVATVVTQVVVDPDDPAMSEPTKPVGPFYREADLDALRTDRGWDMVTVAGKGVRRVVPSPPPIGVVEIDAIAGAAAAGRLVVAGGGGGVPVAQAEDGDLTGVEAVIDKDRTAALIAIELDARGLLILTEVGHASLGYGTPDQSAMLEMSADRAEELLAEGEFPPGSMGPKIEACVSYARATGRAALITSVSALGDAFEGRDGTRVVR
ncbi:MAG TPA: carbamate kinase [Acidimicrobiia bacterium]|nr:carbamate kinase [Acidimicrobiia bacterium]